MQPAAFALWGELVATHHRRGRLACAVPLTGPRLGDDKLRRLCTDRTKDQPDDFASSSAAKLTTEASTLPKIPRTNWSSSSDTALPKARSSRFTAWGTYASISVRPLSVRASR